MTTCVRCGGEAAVRHGAGYYCGKCVLALAWGEVILQAQRPKRRGEQDETTPAEEADRPV